MVASLIPSPEIPSRLSLSIEVKQNCANDKPEECGSFRIAQKEAFTQGKLLVSSYEQFWLPALNRLQATLAFPIPEDCTKTLWGDALDTETIQRLVTDGDCRGGVRSDLAKPWPDVVQNLPEQEILKI